MTEQQPTKSTFTKVPHWLAPLFADNTLKSGTMQVYYAIGMYVDWSTGKGAFPSIATLCRVTGMSERTVQKHIGLLLAVGAIERHARFRQDGSQTSSEVWLVEDPPVTSDTPPSKSAPPPVTNDTPIPRAPYQEPSSPTEVVEVNSLDDPADSPSSQTLGPPADLPLVRRRQLMNAGVTVEQGPQWDQAWTAAITMQWPDDMQDEARQYPDEHLAQHVFQTLERGHPLSPSRWLQFYIADRQRQIGFIRGRREQEARMAEDPAEREARQNRHLPPDRSGDIPTTQDGAGQ